MIKKTQNSRSVRKALTTAPRSLGQPTTLTRCKTPPRRTTSWTPPACAKLRARALRWSRRKGANRRAREDVPPPSCRALQVPYDLLGLHASAPPCVLPSIDDDAILALPGTGAEVSPRRPAPAQPFEGHLEGLLSHPRGSSCYTPSAPHQELAPVRGGGPGRQRGGAVAGLREPHARAPRRGARPLRGGGRGRHREAQGGGQAEALRGPARAPAAKAFRPRRPRGGRVAQGDEAGGLRPQGAARSAPAAAGPLPLRRGPPALTPTDVRGSRPEVGEPYGRLARSLGGDVLGELDDQPLGTADVDEPIDVRVVLDLADRVEPVVPQAVDDRVEVLDLDADVPEAGPVGRPGLRALVVGRHVVLDELQLAGAIGRPHHHQLRPDAGEPVDLVHRLALDRRPALALEPQADEERGRGVEVVHDDTHMIETQHPHIIHSLDVADRWGRCPL